MSNYIDMSSVTGVKLNGVEVEIIASNGVTLWEKNRSVITNPFRIVENSTPSRVVTLTKTGTPPEITLEYSVNKQQWHTWEPDANGNRSYTLTAGNPMHIRGNNPNGLKTSNDDTNYYSFDCDENYSVAGDIRSLISPSVDVTSIPNNCFRDLFRDSTNLISAPFLRLLATTVGSNCYGNMFYGCTAMTRSPHILPATTVNSSSYWRMFYGCSSLQTMPIIDGTTFGASAVREMFYGCSALTNQWASDSPSVETKRAIQFTIASTGQMSLRGMFQNCTSLVNAGGITASQKTNWPNAVCYGMFEGCTALTTTPSITFESFDSGGTSQSMQMFKGCTSLTSASNITLNATTIPETAYAQMFYNCSALTTPPSITSSALTIGASGLQQMFWGCTSMTTAPNLNIANLDSSGTRHCYDLFRGCSALTDVTKVKLNATTLYNQSYHSVFYGCTSLVTPPEIMATTYFSDSTSTTNGSFVEMFYNCSKLSTIKVHFTSWDNGGRGTKNWTYGTKSSGTFYKPSSLPSTKNTSGNTTNPDYIPYDWAVNGQQKISTPLDVTFSKEWNSTTQTGTLYAKFKMPSYGTYPTGLTYHYYFELYSINQSAPTCSNLDSAYNKTVTVSPTNIDQAQTVSLINYDLNNYYTWYVMCGYYASYEGWDNSDKRCSHSSTYIGNLPNR